MNELTDDILLNRVANADAEAFRILLERHERKVYATAWRLCANEAEAQDLTQEVFFKVWKNAGSWQPTAKLNTWMYRILRNLYIDNLRHKKEGDIELSEDIRSDEKTPEEKLIGETRRQQVTEAIGNLPSRQKEALVLCYYQGLKAKEAAEILSITQSALEALLFRARQELKNVLFKNE